MKSSLAKALLIILCFVLSPVVAAGYEKEIKSLSLGMAESISKANKKNVAVVDFTDLQGNVTELGRFLAEEFSVALAGAEKGFEVVDRTHLRVILKENNLASTGLIAPEAAQKLGQIAGVQVLVTGTITPFGDSIRLSAKVLDSSTARVIAGTSVDIARTRAIDELLGRTVESFSAGKIDATGNREAPTTFSAASPKAAPPAPVRVTRQNLTFDLRECASAGTRVTCRFMITNDLDKDRSIAVDTKFNQGVDPSNFSRVMDESGRSYPVSEVSLAGSSSRGQGTIRSALVPQVPTLAVFTFEDIPRDSAMLSLVRVVWWENNHYTADFRGVAVTR